MYKIERKYVSVSFDNGFCLNFVAIETPHKHTSFDDVYYFAE